MSLSEDYVAMQQKVRYFLQTQADILDEITRAQVASRSRRHLEDLLEDLKSTNEFIYKTVLLMREIDK